MRLYFMRTSRLGFSTWMPDDVDLARGLWGDARVTRLIGGPFDERWIEDRLAREISTLGLHGVQYWPIFQVADEAHVGCCGLAPVAGRGDVLELGFHLRADFWGRGFATESARAAMAFAFGQLQVAELVAGHHPQNLASRRVLEGLGFCYTHDAFYRPTGTHHPTYALSSTEFARLKLPSP